MGYLAQARRIPFGEQAVVGYLYAREAEFTAIRTSSPAVWPGWTRTLFGKGCVRPMSNYKIAVLGDKDSSAGLQGPGAGRVPGGERGGGKAHLHALAKENYAVVYLTEGYAAHMEAELERYKDALTPAIILIPGKDGSLGIGMANVKRAVERAVGADIL